MKFRQTVQIVIEEINHSQKVHRNVSSEIFLLQFKLLKLCGFHSLNKIQYFRGINIFHKTVSIMCLVYCILAGILFIHENTFDFLEAAASAGPLLSVIITLVKFVTFSLYREKFYELMDNVKSLSNNLTILDEVYLRKRNIVDRTICTGRIIAAMISLVAFVIKPVLNNIASVSSGNDFSYELPLKASFPYNAKFSPFYELHYLIFSYVSYLAAVVNVSLLSF